MKTQALIARTPVELSEAQIPPPVDEIELDLELVHGGLPRLPVGPKGGITGCIPGCAPDIVPVEDEA